MKVQRGLVGLSPHEFWNNEKMHSRAMFELMINIEREKMQKLNNNIQLQKYALQKLRNELGALPDIYWNPCISNLLRSTGQSPYLERTQQTTPREHTSGSCCSWHRDRKVGRPTGRVDDKVRRTLRMTTSNGKTYEHPNINPNFFKTETCRSWRKFGVCIYGENCNVAHGFRELRVKPVPLRNYKTEMCKKFLAGHCPYGSRCCFVHNLTEGYSNIGVAANSKLNRDMARRWQLTQIIVDAVE